MNAHNITRRHFFGDCGVGVGKIALASLLAGNELPASALSGTLQRPHHKPKARAVIHLFMAGAPSQLELFDHKPTLAKYEGKPIPPSVIGGQRYAFIRPDAAVLESTLGQISTGARAQLGGNLDRAAGSASGAAPRTRRTHRTS